MIDGHPIERVPRYLRLRVGIAVRDRAGAIERDPGMGGDSGHADNGSTEQAQQFENVILRDEARPRP